MPDGLLTRLYGDSGSTVVVLHGGPGVAGYMAPVCRELSHEFHVVEPLQRESGEVRLSIERHVIDLLHVVRRHSPGGATLVGHSWGAMLALAFAAQHPQAVQSLVLVGCGTFDLSSRSILESTLASRMTLSIRDKLRRNSVTIKDPDVRMCVDGRILEPLYSCQPIPHSDETEWYDARGHRESWGDMLRLQRNGIYPAAFSYVGVPVLMMHGDYDPHPGRSTYDTLQTVMPQIEYEELVGCGHYPWWEQHGRGAFFTMLREWLARHAR